MRKIKETLRLKHEFDLKHRAIARAVCIAPSTVGDYLNRAAEAGLGWPLPDGLDDDELNRLLFAQPDRPASAPSPLPDWEHVRRELTNKSVTRQLLWEEYIEEHAEGYSYSRFCELYREWTQKLDPTMRFDHKAGERAFIDYPGPRIRYIDAETGELLEASLFVAVLGASNYTFCEAHAAEDLPNWIRGHCHAFAYWGGVPEILVPDNLKAGVTSPCRYEPDVNPTFHEMAMHYGVAVIPTRVRSPRDKAKAETAVQVAERWVMAPLRNEIFVGLGALNAAVGKRREKLNDRVMRVVGMSRRKMFEEIDKPALRPLPNRPYELGEWKKARVAIDYHVQFDYHYYSVPYELIHDSVDIRATATTIEVFHSSVRVASHLRSRHRGGHTTVPEHMPEGHRQYMEWTPERVERWADKIGPQTAKLVAAVMAARQHPEQGFRSCLGIIRLAKKYSEPRLESAAERALHYGALSYKSVKNILDAKLDESPIEDDPSQSPAAPHANVRGSGYYK